jgi:hypothetical protein
MYQVDTLYWQIVRYKNNENFNSQNKMRCENRKVIIRQFKLNKNKKIHQVTALHYRSLSQ